MNKLLLAISIIVLVSCGEKNTEEETTDAHSGATQTDKIHYEGETHLKNIRQLTFGGDNAEAYWSFNDEMLVFQATNPAWEVECDQIYVTRWQGFRSDHQ